MTYHYLVDNVFHVMNAGMLVGVGYFLLKKYLVKTLHQEMVAQELMRSLLYRKRDMLYKQQNDFIVGCQRQDELCCDFTHKIELWRKDVQQKALQSDKMQEKIRADLAQREERRQRERTASVVRAIIVRESIKRVQQNLQESFVYSEQANVYTKSVISHMRKDLI